MFTAFGKRLSGFMACTVAAVVLAGCPDPDASIIDPPSLQASSTQRDETTLSRTCGKAGDHMIVSFTGAGAVQCGDKVTVGGVEATGTRAYNERDGRWTLGFLVPEGVASGPVTVVCDGTTIALGDFTVPCAPEVPGANRFERFSGDLTIGAGCDDPDGKISLGSFTPTSFVVTGLGDNAPITVTVAGDVATGEGVRQFGKEGHTVRLVIQSNGELRFEASSPAGSCGAKLGKG